MVTGRYLPFAQPNLKGSFRGKNSGLNLPKGHSTKSSRDADLDSPLPHVVSCVRRYRTVFADGRLGSDCVELPDQKGLAKRFREAQLAIARTMLADGESVERVTKVTRLRAEEIAELQQHEP